MNLRVRHRLSLASFLAFTAIAFPAIESPADFRATLEAARTERDPVRHSLEFGSGLRRWMEQDPEAALAYVRQLPHGPDYTQGLLLVLDAMGQHDPARALTLARGLAVTREECAFYSSLFARIARDNVPSAVRLLDLVPEGEGRENAIRALADAWAPVDFLAAFAWAQGLAVSAGRSAAIESTLAALAAVDPPRTILLAQQSLLGPALDRILLLALQQLTPADPRAAAAIVRALPAGETQAMAATDVARALAAVNPADAIAWCEGLPDERARRLALDNAIEVWAAGDAMAAGQYVAHLELGPAQVAAAVHLARFLGGRAPRDAIAWTRTLADIATRDAALAAIASAWAQHDAAAATQWAATLPARKTQAEAMSGAFSNWTLQDPHAAQAWLATANLSAELKIRLKSPGPQN